LWIQTIGSHTNLDIFRVFRGQILEGVLMYNKQITNIKPLTQVHLLKKETVILGV